MCFANQITAFINQSLSLSCSRCSVATATVISLLDDVCARVCVRVHAFALTFVLWGTEEWLPCIVIRSGRDGGMERERLKGKEKGGGKDAVMEGKREKGEGGRRRWRDQEKDGGMRERWRDGEK